MRRDGQRRRRPRSAGTDRAGPDRWMISYADFLTLVLAFFVVLFAAVRTPAPPPAAAAPAHPPAPPPTVDDDGELEEVRAAIETLARLSSLEGRILARLETRGLAVSLVEAGFYEPGRAVPRPDALPVIDALGTILRETDHHIRIEGHTDDVPIRTVRFPSNWELSTARATWLVAYLVERFGMDPTRLSAAGYGEYRPITPNDSPEGRARNRRVDVVLLRRALVEDEPAAAPGP